MKENKLPPQKKSKFVFYVTVSLEEAAFISEMARAAVKRKTTWIKHVIFTGRYPKIKIHPWQADVYRELQMTRLMLDQLPQRIPKEQLPELMSRLDHLEALYFTTLQIMTNVRTAPEHTARP